MNIDSQSALNKNTYYIGFNISVPLNGSKNNKIFINPDCIIVVKKYLWLVNKKTR